MILPGSTLGLLGGGQLGRFFVLAAIQMGYRVMVLDPDPYSPAGALADQHICADYHDKDALTLLADNCVAITTEFENIPAQSLRFFEGRVRVRPSADAVEVTQNRIAEKDFLLKAGLPITPYANIRSRTDFSSAEQAVSFPALLKRASFGYDGKGQIRVDESSALPDAFAALDEVPCVLEQMVDLACEISVVLARTDKGEMVCYPVAENEHRKGILALSTVPAQVDDEIADRAASMARSIAQALDYCGVLAVEFFLTRSGALLVNEIAPRPHNSGHYTVDACVCSQFEQQLRTLCGVPLGDVRLLSPVSMVNLLGDRWSNGTPRWVNLYAMPGARLHLYGKREPRSGRKMGHICVLADTREQAVSRAERLDRTL